MKGGRLTRIIHPSCVRRMARCLQEDLWRLGGPILVEATKAARPRTNSFKDSPCAAWCVRLVRRYKGGEVEGVPYCGANDKKAAKSTVQKVCTSSMGRLSHVLDV